MAKTRGKPAASSRQPTSIAEYKRRAAAVLKQDSRTREVRQDRWVNHQTGLGTWEDKTRAGFFSPTLRLVDTEITDLANSNDLAAKLIEKRPTEMYRRGYELEPVKSGIASDNEIKPSDLKELLEFANKELKFDIRFQQGMKFGRQYGGALLLLGIDDGRPPWAPVDEDNIRAVRTINMIDRRFAYVQSYYSDYMRPKYGEARTYLVSNGVATSIERDEEDDPFSTVSVEKSSKYRLQKLGNSILNIHESRVIRFDGVETDVITRQTLAGWSWSILQRPYEVLRQTDSSFDALCYLISDASQAVMKLKGLFRAVETGNKSKLEERMKMLERTRSVMRGIALDAGGEEDFTRVGTPLTGIPDSIDRMMQRCAAAFDMPLTELFGMSPAGMNATGESDRIKWYDTIASDQQNYLSPLQLHVLRLIMLSKRGPMRGREVPIKIHYHPLYAPTEDEVSKTRLQNAQRDQIYVEMNGPVTADIVALGLSDVYPNLKPEDIEAEVDAKTAFDPHENDLLRSAPAQALNEGHPVVQGAPKPGGGVKVDVPKPPKPPAPVIRAIGGGASASGTPSGGGNASGMSEGQSVTVPLPGSSLHAGAVAPAGEGTGTPADNQRQPANVRATAKKDADDHADARGIHVLIHRTGEGTRIALHPTKAAAHEAGMAMRRAGENVSVFSLGDYKKYVDPSFDESKHPRGPDGKFDSRHSDTKDPGPNVALDVFNQLKKDFGEKASSWALAAQWEGPKEVDLSRIDFSTREKWHATRDPDKVKAYAEKLDKLAPIILIDQRGSDLLDPCDGHHRLLAYELKGLPAVAYVASVQAARGPWTDLHTMRQKGSAGEDDGTTTSQAGSRSRADGGHVARHDDFDESKVTRDPSGKFSGGGVDPKSGKVTELPAGGEHTLGHVEEMGSSDPAPIRSSMKAETLSRLANSTGSVEDHMRAFAALKAAAKAHATVGNLEKAKEHTEAAEAHKASADEAYAELYRRGSTGNTPDIEGFQDPQDKKDGEQDPEEWLATMIANGVADALERHGATLPDNDKRADDFDESQHPRDPTGQFASAGGTGMGASHSLAAAGRNVTNAHLKHAFKSVVSAIRAAPKAIGKAALDEVKEKIADVKNAALGVGHFLTGKPVSHEEKKAIAHVAVTVAAAVIASHLTPLLVGFAHVGEGAAGKVVEKVGDQVAHYVIEHIANRGLKLDTAGLALVYRFDFSAELTDDDVDDWLATKISLGLADAVEKSAAKLTHDADWDESAHPRDPSGKFGSGSASSAAPDHGAKHAFSQIASMLRKAPAALGRAALKEIKSQVHDFKEAAGGVKALLTGNTVTPEQRKAITHVAVITASYMVSLHFANVLGGLARSPAVANVTADVASRAADWVMDQMVQDKADWAEEDHPRDEAGRFGSGGGIARTLTEKAVKKGGFSYRPGEGAPKDGFMVSLPTSAGVNHVVDIKAIASRNPPPSRAQLKTELAGHVREWLKKAMPVARGSADHFLGGWVQKDEKTNRPVALHLDISERHTDRDLAIQHGRERNQMSVWDVAKGEEIPTGGTGT